jgi:hypothetical protein
MIEKVTTSKRQSVDAECALVQHFCVPFLVTAQNQDGGWGFETKSESRVEPTCWAIRSLLNSSTSVSEECLSSAYNYLLRAQLKDGSWPAMPQTNTGSWVTSLACSVLSVEKKYENNVCAGLNWLCNDYPRDSRLWRRILGRIRSRETASSHDDSFRGWGWTPSTASWVEPTSFAMQALYDSRESLRPRESSARLELAAGFLYDRMCPSGGWNCGNPMVYGIAGEPLVLSTCWALLALRNYAPHQRKTLSLEWLANTFPTITSTASLAIARITLEAYGNGLPTTCPSLDEMFKAQAFLRTVLAASWMSLALSPIRKWFPKVESSL